MTEKKIITNIRINTGEIGMANSFQPRANGGRLVTETYQPRGSAQVPRVIPQLVSGVAPRPPQPTQTIAKK